MSYDVQSFDMIADTDANVNCARIRVRGKLVNTGTDQTIPGGDFTGANFVQFALRVQGFTVAQHRALAEIIALEILRMKAGV